MSIRRKVVGLALVVVPLAGCAVVDAGSPDGTGGMRPFQTWQARKYTNVVRQQTDFTCGAASLSTISEYYYGRPISENDFTRTMRERYSDEEWGAKEKDGLSLLDMKLAAEKLGFKAEGVKMTLVGALSLRGPIIIHLDKGYAKHFSVLRGVQGDRAYLADPVIGNVRVPLYRFAEQWTGYALAIWVDGADLPVDHRLMIKAADLTYETPVARRFLYTTQPPPIPNRL